MLKPDPSQVQEHSFSNSTEFIRPSERCKSTIHIVGRRDFSFSSLTEELLLVWVPVLFPHHILAIIPLIINVQRQQLALGPRVLVVVGAYGNTQSEPARRNVVQERWKWLMLLRLVPGGIQQLKPGHRPFDGGCGPHTLQ